MPRLFAALEMPQQASTRLTMVRGGLPGARWIDPENYHLTLRFMGDVDYRTADEIADRLDRITPRPLTINIEGLGAFGGKKPHSIFAVVSPNPELSDLQADIERMCQRMGLPPDSRKFTPHVTIARLRNVSPDGVARFLSSRGGFQVPPFTIGRFVLMSSRDSIGGGPYIVEDAYPLASKDYAQSRSASASAELFTDR